MFRLHYRYLLHPCLFNIHSRLCLQLELQLLHYCYSSTLWLTTNFVFFLHYYSQNQKFSQLSHFSVLGGIIKLYTQVATKTFLYTETSD